MNQTLLEYNPPSFDSQARDFPSFRNDVRDFLRDRFAQYQVNFLKQLLFVSNSGTQGLASADVVAAATISPTAWMTRITGAGTITTIKPPNGFQSFIVLISMGGFSLGAGGNIAIAGGPFAIGQSVFVTYDPKAQMWCPDLGDAGSLSGAVFEVGATSTGKPAAGATILLVPFARQVTFPANLTGSQGVLGVATTNAQVFNLFKNGIGIGSMNFAMGATVATFTFATQVVFSSADTISMVAPNPQDATLATVGFMLQGTRV